MKRGCRKPYAKRVGSSLKLISMNSYKLILSTTTFFTLLASAQEPSLKRPFSIGGGAITVTGTYSEGQMYKRKVNGTNILWGLMSWGGSQEIDCRPGNGVCVVSVSVSFHFKGVTTSQTGTKSLAFTGKTAGAYPVVVSKEGNTICFVVDIGLVPSERKLPYESGTWTVTTPFVLSPETVRELGLYSGPEAMGFVIPAGNYPLYRDGNIRYWTWTIPQ